MPVSGIFRSLLIGSALVAVAPSFGATAAAPPPADWDGLVQVSAKNVDLLYLRPGADFRPYSAIVLDPAEVAFRKNWQREVARSRMGSSRVSDADVRHAIDRAQGTLRAIFEKRLRETGFQIAQAPAENALRVFVGIANVDVAAPDVHMGSSTSFSAEAGQATLVIEVRDSLSGELLGRAVDHGHAGDHLMTLRTSSSNWADFEQLFDEWARISARGLRRLIASAPAAAQ